MGAASGAWIVCGGNLVNRLFSGMAASVSPFGAWDRIGDDHHRRCKPSGLGTLGSASRDGRPAALVRLGVWLNFCRGDFPDDWGFHSEDPHFSLQLWGPVLGTWFDYLGI